MIRNLEKWLPTYLYGALRPRRVPSGLVTICVAVGDHFEPWSGNSGRERALDRLQAWEEGLPRLASGLADSRGRPPQHDFFYPLEEYRPEVLDRLAKLCAQGLGGVEVHLHHHGESRAQLEDMLSEYVEILFHRHGLLRKDPKSGATTYGFIHGNWALDNSHPHGLWCGRNDELSILKKTGCYADFTLPSAPGPCQTRTINSIYYATDDPQAPKSHDSGRPAQKGVPPSGDLLLVQGILSLDWRWRKWGIMPRVENSDLGAHRPPHPHRAALWLKHAPVVKGAENVLFIKLACHGAPERHHESLFGAPARRLWKHLIKNYNDGKRWRLLFMTCWEMVQAIHTLEMGGEIH